MIPQLWSRLPVEEILSGWKGFSGGSLCCQSAAAMNSETRQYCSPWHPQRVALYQNIPHKWTLGKDRWLWFIIKSSRSGFGLILWEDRGPWRYCPQIQRGVIKYLNCVTFCQLLFTCFTTFKLYNSPERAVPLSADREMEAEQTTRS